MRRLTPRSRRSGFPRLSENGQSAVLLALMFMAILVFVGLATDAGIIYMSFGQLRRAADAAALGAASQLREARKLDQLTETATQFIRLQGLQIQPGDVVVETCETIPTVGVIPTGPTHPKIAQDPSICTWPVRKLVRVKVTTRVSLAFMQLFGWHQPLPLTTSAVSEAASLEIMLVIDTSYSMTYDAGKNMLPENLNGVDDDNDGCVDELAAQGCDSNSKNDNWLSGVKNYAGNDNTPTCNDPPATTGIAIFMTDGTKRLPPPSGVAGVNFPVESCRPFEWVRDAAVNFVSSFVNFPFDRVAIITFADQATVVQPLGSTNATSLTDTIQALGSIHVSGPTCRSDQVCPNPDPYTVCPLSSHPNYTVQGAVGACQNTNTGDALSLALAQLQTYARSSALRFMILLSDGAATASSSTANTDNVGVYKYYACSNNNKAYDLTPGPTYNPYGDPYFNIRPCSDGDSRDTTDPSGGRHGVGDVAYDADDYARDKADAVSNDGTILLFTIGLGKEVTDNPGVNSFPTGCAAWNSTTVVGPKTFTCNPDGGYASGEQLLRYIADVGDDDRDGDLKATDGINYGCKRDDTLGGVYTFQAGKSCGNYFYAQGGADIAGIFSEIASRIFTRITE
jgi:Flp pilus assembly protein TadG